MINLDGSVLSETNSKIIRHSYSEQRVDTEKTVFIEKSVIISLQINN